MDINFLEIVGLATIIVALPVSIMLFVEWFNSWFKKWRTCKCKIKCLCKHRYEIQWIDGHYDMMIMCKICGKAKKLHFSGESLEVFGFKFKI